MNNEALLATAAAKSNALSGLVDALEYGRITARRADGVDYVYARGDKATFELRFGNDGRVHCRGYVVSSTARDLARDALHAARDGRHCLND